MSDEESSSPAQPTLSSPAKRTIKKTAAIAAHDSKVEESGLRRTILERNKLVREENAALEAEDNTAKKPEKRKPKDKAGAETSTGSTAKSGSSNGASKKKQTTEEANVAEMMKEGIEWNKLTQLVSIRDARPIEELKLLDLAELEVMWESGPGSGQAKAKATNSKKAAPNATTKTAKAATKAPAKTPAKKISSSMLRKTSVANIGSPLLALKVAKEQSAGATAGPPAPQTRKQDISTDRSEGGNKRIRANLEPDPTRSTKAPKNTTTSKPLAHPGLKQSKGSSTSRASSLIPSIRATSSQPIGRSAAVHPGQFAIYDDEEIHGLSPAEEEFSGEELDALAKGKPRGKRARPTRGQFEGLDLKLADVGLRNILLVMLLENMCPEAHEYDQMIQRGWMNGVVELGLDPEEYPMSKRMELCIRSRINSFRGRVRDKVLSAMPSTYRLNITDEVDAEEVMCCANRLCEDRFHKDPKVANPRSGHYQHDFIPVAVYQILYVGQDAVGKVHKDKFQVAPIPLVAFVCGLIQNLLGYYTALGYYEKTKKSSLNDVKVPMQTHLENLRKFERLQPHLCVIVLEKIAVRALEQSGEVVSPAGPKPVGLLGDDDFDPADELTAEQLEAARQSLRAAKSNRSSAVAPAVALATVPTGVHTGEPLSDAELSNMEAFEVQAHLDRVTPGSCIEEDVPISVACQQCDSDEESVLSGSEGRGLRSHIKNGHTFVSLSNDDGSTSDLSEDDLDQVADTDEAEREAPLHGNKSLVRPNVKQNVASRAESPVEPNVASRAESPVEPIVASRAESPVEPIAEPALAPKQVAQQSTAAQDAAKMQAALDLLKTREAAKREENRQQEAQRKKEEKGEKKVTAAEKKRLAAAEKKRLAAEKKAAEQAPAEEAATEKKRPSRTGIKQSGRKTVHN